MVNYYPKKVFIGSSNENRNTAKKIAKILKDDRECSPILWWTPEVFTGGQYTFESILKVAHKVDAGIFLLAEDDVTYSRDRQFMATRANVVLEAGVFYGVLGCKNVGLCTIGSPDIPRDWDGITRISFNQEDITLFKQELKRWLENVVYVNHKEPPNVHMASRENIHTLYPIDVRLGFNKDELGEINNDVSKYITKLRILCLTGNSIINPEEMVPDIFERHKSVSISKAIYSILANTTAELDLILANPTESILKDVHLKIANPRGGAKKTSYSALKTLYELLTSNEIFVKAFHERRFHCYLADLYFPFAIFAVEYKSKYAFLNHVKIDPYSLYLTDEDEMRTMIIWQNSDKNNYDFFVSNFDTIRRNLEPLKKPGELKNFFRKMEK